LDHLGTHRFCLELSSALLPVGDRSIMPGTAATVSATASSPDPVGSGIVESLSQPGGNVTGFTNHEYSIGPKWLEFLKEIAPAVRRVGILRDPTNAAEIVGMLGTKARGLLHMLRVAAIPN
jgi:ABC transporter substrate binding protein